MVIIMTVSISDIYKVIYIYIPQNTILNFLIHQNCLKLLTS